MEDSPTKIKKPEIISGFFILITGRERNGDIWFGGLIGEKPSGWLTFSWDNFELV